jgi:uncharacterized repeat protein (TIGR01451 family)
MKSISRRFRPQLEHLEGRRLLAGDLAGGEVIYHEDFESGNGGYVANNTGGNLPGLWHYTDGRSADGLPGHSPANSWYYGDLENVTGGGQYATYDTHRGTLTSPLITLPANCHSELSFNYFLETRPPVNLDFVEVYVIDGATSTRVLSRSMGDLIQGTGVWQSATADLSAFSGREIQLQFLFDTGPAIAIDPEGWYVDDIVIRHFPSADLSITKSVDDDTPNEGQLITYTIVVSNSNESCSTATGVIVTDQLPLGVTVDDFSVDAGRFDPITGIWDELELPPGESRTLTLSVIVDAGLAGSLLTNVVTVSGDQDDPDSSNDRAEQPVTVNRVDISAEKSASNNSPIVGDAVTFEIEVTNAATSNAVATGVTLVDVLPEGLTFVSASDTGIYDASTRTITWDLADIAIGDSQLVSLVATVDSAGMSLTNLARVTAQETDPDPTNNESTTTITPIPATADLSVTKEASNDAPIEGTQFFYTIVASNAADSIRSATGVTVMDVLPSGVTFNSADPDDGSFDESTGIWTVGNLPQGTSQTLILTVTVNFGTAGTTVTNTAEIDGDQDDPDRSNNEATKTITPVPVPSANVAVTKTVNDIAPIEGTQVTYTIVASNASDSISSATGVIVTDVLPSGVTFDSADPDDGSFDEIAGVWTIGELAQGTSQTLVLTVTVNGGTAGTPISNTAVISADQPDPDMTDNTDTAITNPAPIQVQTVQFLAPLSVFRASTPVLPAASQIAMLGYVWHDTNTNGVWDATEVGVDGATVSLFQNDTLFASLQTRRIDVNRDGAIDTATESGVYFLESDALPNGIYQVRITLPDGVDTTFPGSSFVDVTGGQLEVTIDSTAVLSERPIGTARQPNGTDTSATNFGISEDFVLAPGPGFGTIIGYSWADVDMDGQWDAGEQARRGAEYFLDLDNDGVFDPELGELFSITDDEGRYYFPNLTPGTYFVRELSVNRDNPENPGGGRVILSTFPRAEVSEVLPAHTVVVAGGNVVQGTRGVANAPNFGANEIGRYVRPADVYLDWLTKYPLLQNSLATTQSFTVSNTTGSSFDITQINKLNLTAKEADYITVKQVAADGSLIDPVLPLSLAASESVDFLLFYAPVQRDGLKRVLAQQPEWLDPAGDRTAHTFGTDALVEVVTNRELKYPVKLIGGSTFDSDINYDGVVDRIDLEELNDLLLREPVINEQSPLFDPSKDINVRCPNGANQITGTCDFPVGGPPAREISFGDFGTMNVEVARLPRSPIAIELALPPDVSVPMMSEAAVGGEPIDVVVSRHAIEPSFLESSCPAVQANSSEPAAEKTFNEEQVPQILTQQIVSDEIAWCDPNGLSTELDDDERLRLIDEFFGMLA